MPAAAPAGTRAPAGEGVPPAVRTGGEDARAAADGSAPPSPRANVGAEPPPPATGAALSGAARGTPAPTVTAATPAPAATLAEEAQRASAGGEGVAPADGGAPARSTPAGTATAPAPATASPAPQTVLPQIAARAAEAAGGSEVTIRLDPPELGSVRITLNAEGAQITATITAERTEVEHMLRRHAGALAEALGEAGYDGVDLAFHRDPERDAPPPGAAPAPDGAAPPAEAAPAPGAAPLAPPPIPGRLDLRF